MIGTDERRAEDVELMRRVAGSDEAAVAQLYDRFAALIRRMARQALSRRCDLEDVVQAVFVLLWRNAARYDPERASLVTWVMLITRRRIIDTLRQLHRVNQRTVRPADSPVAFPDESPERHEAFDLVVTRMQVLNELQRTVLTRAYFRGQSLRRIGEDLSTPLGTIKTALRRGMDALRVDALRQSPRLVPSQAGAPAACVGGAA